MARRPLAAIVVLAVALWAPAQPDARAQRTTTLEQARREAAEAFAAKKPLRAEDVEALRPVAAQRKWESFESFAKLHAQARYLQKGREPQDDPETYATMIKSVARRLGLPQSRYPELVALYSGAVIDRGAAASLPAAEREAEVAARRDIELDIRRNRGLAESTRRRVQADMRVTSRSLLESLTSPEMVPAAAAAAIPGPASSAEFRERTQTAAGDAAALPQVQRPLFMTSPTPPPGGFLPVTSTALSWDALAGWLDFSKGYDVAREALTGTLKWARSMGSMCYQFVKQALIDAGVIDAPNPQSTGAFGLRPNSARMLNEDIRRNPQLLAKMGYRRADLSALSDDASRVPDGSLLGYDAGCSFADATHGHAEIVVSDATYDLLRAENRRLPRLDAAANEVRVCHFSCTTRTTAFMRTYGTDRRTRAGQTIPACLKLYVPVKQ